MPWLIQHKCNMSGEITDYAIMRAEHNGQKLTKVVCPKPDCREEFIIIGHEMFGEATDSKAIGPGLPPGFWLPKTFTH